MNTQITTTRLDVSNKRTKEHKMNTLKSIVLKFGLALVAALILGFAAAQLYRPASSPAKANLSPAIVYDAKGAMENAIVYSWEVKSAPAKLPMVYDATGVMQDSVVLPSEVHPASSKLAPVYDATAAMHNSVVFSWEMKAPPAKLPVFYDATAEMLKSIVLP